MTISDIAKMAGVSSAAVSRYLNGGSLSEEKRTVIHEVIERTGYKPDAAAQTLRTGRVNQIGVIVPKINSESVSQVTAGIASELDDSKYLMLLGITNSREARETSYLTAMQRNHVAGIILMGTVLTPSHVEAFRTCSVPLVVTGQRFPDIPCVYNDDRNATRELAQRMLDRGRRRLAYIGVPEKDVATGRERRLGVQDALRAAGLDADHMPHMYAGFDQQSGYSIMCELLAKCPELDGVVCATDTIAIGAFHALKDAGRQVPQDVSLAGVGDSWAGTILEPKLTTIHLYQSQVGVEAARMLLQMIGAEKEKTEGPVRQMTLGYTVVERGSI